MNPFWTLALEIDRRLRAADIAYCIIKVYGGDPTYQDGNIDVVVDAPLLDVAERVFVPAGFRVSARDRKKHRLYETNKLMVEQESGALPMIHLHANSGWHDLCFVDAQTILDDARDVPMGDGQVRLLGRDLEARILALQVMFENFQVKPQDRDFIEARDYEALIETYDLPPGPVRRVAASEGPIRWRTLWPIWRVYYGSRSRDGAVTLRNRLLHAAYVALKIVRKLRAALGLGSR